MCTCNICTLYEFYLIAHLKSRRWKILTFGPQMKRYISIIIKSEILEMNPLWMYVLFYPLIAFHRNEYIMKKRLFRNQPALHSNNTSLRVFRYQPVHVLPSAGWKVVSMMLVANACRRRTNSLLFDFGGRLICKLCHIVASHFPPRSPKQLVALLGEGSATYCRERAWMHRQINALKHSGRCVSCEIKLAGSFHRWMQLDCFLTFSVVFFFSGFLSKQAICKCSHVDFKNVFNNWQDRWPLPWHDGKATEALSFKRLSVTELCLGLDPFNLCW